jgi:hypothetical protein
MKFTEFRAVPNAAAAHQGPLTVSSSAVTLLSLLSGGALHAETRFVEITVETDDVRLTVQGTTPTSSLGRLLLVDSSRLLSRAEADLAKIIRVTTDAALQVTQYTN